MREAFTTRFTTLENGRRALTFSSPAWLSCCARLTFFSFQLVTFFQPDSLSISSSAMKSPSTCIEAAAMAAVAEFAVPAARAAIGASPR